MPIIFLGYTLTEWLTAGTVVTGAAYLSEKAGEKIANGQINLPDNLSDKQLDKVLKNRQQTVGDGMVSLGNGLVAIAVVAAIYKVMKK